MNTRQKAQGKRQTTAAIVALTFFLFPFSFFLPPCQAQEPAGDTTYTKQPVFRIPFQTDPGERRLKQVQLYVSVDLGRSWHPYASARPEEGFFTFTASRDGVYWFTVRTVDQENRAYPLTMESARPGLKVSVDTHAPGVQLKSPSPREGLSAVEWEILDDNLDLTTLNLEYRPQGMGEWIPLRVESPAVVGQHFWKPVTNGTLEVRLRVRDRNGNEGEARTSVGTPSDNRDLTSRSDLNRTNALPPPNNPAVRLVNSKHINLNYEVKDVGRSGISIVELWYTQDGRHWQKHSEDPNHRPPYTVDVTDAGLYGFSLVVRSGVGLSDRPPQTGDSPQVWVEVDLTKPVVQLTNVDVGRGQETGNLTITWTASDKNIARQPITLSYAEQPSGPWVPIVSNIDNTGRHVWRMPQDVPYRFLVRVEVADRAGNVGSAETPKPVIVDLSQPKGVIVNVEPGK